jgi:DGQHR domain-containing protein
MILILPLLFNEIKGGAIMSKNKIRSKYKIGLNKEDQLAICERLLKKYPNGIITLKMLRVNQGDKYNLFTCSIPVDLSFLIFQRVPKEYNNLTGLQRMLNTRNVEEIQEAANDPMYTSPNCLVANILTSRKGVEFINATDDDLAYLNINILEIAKNLQKSTADENGFAQSQESYMLGYLIDSQHRTLGQFLAGQMDFCNPSTIYIDLDTETRQYNVYSSINEKQNKSSSITNIANKKLGRRTLPLEDVAYELMDSLNSSKGSILLNRIKETEERPKDLPKEYISIDKFLPLLKEDIIENIPADYRIKDTLYDVTNNYYTAWSKAFPEAWNDTKNHVLVKRMGITLISKLFKEIYYTVQVLYGNQTISPKELEFRNVIQMLFNEDNIDLYERERKTKELNYVRTLPLDFSSKVYGDLSNGKGIGRLIISFEHLILNKRPNLRILQQKVVI